MRELRKLFVVIVVLLVFGVSVHGQDAPSAQEKIQALQAQALELKAMLDELQAKVETLNKELEENQAKLASSSAEKLEEDQKLLDAKVEELHQTKVESDSKYRVKLSGAILVNLFDNKGAVDSIDVPAFALPPGGSYSSASVGGTIRQSLIGLDVFGPEIKGARVSADIQFDFAGGFPNSPEGVTFGLPRLRTGVVRMSWPKTTLVAGQDVPFFSPLSPTSVASIAVPALSYSGNLWTWTPQVRVEHSLDLTAGSSLIFQGGVLDPLTGEAPSSEFLRTAEAGEASGRPAYASRIAWSKAGSEHPMQIGVGAYYSRQDWGFQRNIDGWAATSDWTVPLPGRLELSGEFYRGSAVGGLGGGLGRSVLLSGAVTDPTTLVRGLDAVGGWAQAKFRQTEKLEWNGAFGEDNLMAGDLRYFPTTTLTPTYYSYLARNQSAMFNFIYKPRTGLLFSTEYRLIRTFSIQGNSEKAGHLNLSMGVLF